MVEKESTKYLLEELFTSIAAHFNQLNLFILSNIWILICILPALWDENTLSDKAGKNGQKQYNPSVRERQKKNPQTLSPKVRFALYCSASFPPILATAPGAANQGPGGGARASHRGVTAVHCPLVTAPGTSTAVHLLGIRTGFFWLFQQGLANNLEQNLPSLPPPSSPFSFGSP